MNKEKKKKPLWLKALLIIIAIPFALLIIAVACGLLLQLNKPVEAVDYASMFNELGSKCADKDNARLLYEQAVENIVDIAHDDDSEITLASLMSSDNISLAGLLNKGYSRLTEEEIQLLSANLQENSAAIRMYKEASKLPCFEPEQVDNLTQYSDNRSYAGMNRCLQLVTLDADHKLAAGDVAGAIDNCLALSATADKILGMKTAIYWDSLTGMTSKSSAASLMLRIAEHANLTKEQIQKFRAQLTLPDWQNLAQMQPGEVLCQKATLQDAYGSFGLASPKVFYDKFSVDRDWIEKVQFTFITGFAPGKKGAEKLMEDNLETYTGLMNTLPWDNRNADFNLMRPYSGPGSLACSLLDLMLDVVAETRICADTLPIYRCILIGTDAALAVKEFELDNGSLPESLEQLQSAEYITEMPRDYYGPGPLVYKKTGDSFVLYGRHINFIDDGGDRKMDNVIWPDQAD